jgi:hypothetical protein
VTTEAAARLYEAQHLLQWAGRPLAIFNPSNRPVDELPTIYGFNNGGGGGGLYHAVLIAEDGTFLGSHGCSSEGYMPADLGCLEGSRPDRHETFKEHYPDGYRMSFVPHSQIAGHEKLNAAFEFNRKMAEAAEATA